MSQLNRGFTLITALFLLTVVALLSVYMITIRNVQQSTVVFGLQGARAMQQIARNSYAAEIGKFVMAVTGFMLVFAMVRPLEGWAVFASYGVMLVIQIIGAWLLLRNSAAGNS